MSRAKHNRKDAQPTAPAPWAPKKKPTNRVRQEDRHPLTPDFTRHGDNFTVLSPDELHRLFAGVQVQLVSVGAGPE